MNNFLLFIGGVLIIALGSAFAVPQFIEWNEYRTVFEDEASRLLGRRIRVGGKVDLRLLPSPYVRFEQLRIADSAGRFGLPFFKADSFTMYLSVAPLLQGNVEANQIELTRPRLRLGVDENGNGNWRNLGPKAASSQYLPADVALQSVKITDGLIAMLDPTGNELYRLDAINGIFSAASIAGPYMFKGVAANRGVEREIRFASSRGGADGSVPFKSIVDFPKSGARYVLNGKVKDLSGRPKVEGDLTAKLPLKLTRQAGAGKAAATKASKAAAGVAAFDLKSKFQADSNGLKLSDLTLSFEQAGRPQIVKGDVTTKWGKGGETAASFKALWLDLDRIAGIGKGGGPVRAFAGFVGQLDQLLGDAGSSHVSLKIDQANLGGDTVSNIALDLSKTGGALGIKALRADMPGRARLEASGTVTGARGRRSFDGRIALHGSNLSRFAAWSGKGYALPPLQGSDYFGVRSRLTITPGALSARDITGEIAQTVFHGAMHYRWLGKKTLTLDLEGPRLDARKLLPDGLRIAGLGKRLLAVAGTGKPGGDGKAGDSLDAAVKLRIGELVAPRITYQDVVADMALRDGKLTISTLKLSSADDLSVALSGDLAAAASAPKGVIRGQVKARSGEALQALARIFALPDAYIPDAARAKALAPMWLAGKVAFAQRRAGSADVTLAGTADGSRVNVIARLDGGLNDWRHAMTDISAEAVSANLSDLIIQLLPRAAGLPIAAAGPGTGRFKAVGLPLKGLFTIASITADGFNTSFDGRLTVPPGGGATMLAGKMRIDAAEAAPFAALAGLRGDIVGANMPLRGRLSVKTGGNDIALGDIALRLAGSDITGTASIASSQKEGTRVEADLSASSASFLALLKPVLNDAGAAAAAAGAYDGGVWPDAAFSFALFDDMQGRLTLKTPRLVLDEDLSLANAVLDAEFGKGRVALTSLAGDLMGGRFDAAFQLDSAPAGAKASGRLAITGAALGKLMPQPGDRPPAAAGTASLSLAFSGQALSPRGLMSVLTGSGEIDLGPARLNRMAPIAVDNAADAVLSLAPDDPVQALRDELRVRLGRGDMELGPRKIKLTVADGALKLQRFGIDTPGGDVSMLNTIDLTTLKLDSEWRISPKAQRSKITGQMLTQLPPVVVSYVGRLGQLAALQPQIDTEALARELTVRKMERDVEELERIRKLDEERARLEAERLAALEAEAESLRAAEAAAALAAERLQYPQSKAVPPPVDPGAGTQSIAPPAAPGAAPQSLPPSSPPAAPSTPGLLSQSTPPSPPPVSKPKPKPRPRNVPRPNRAPKPPPEPSFFEQTFGE